MFDVVDDGSEFRAEHWDEYVGQEALKARLDVHIDSAIERMQRLEHVFLHGPPGCGKTTLAGVIADRLNIRFSRVIMPLDDRPMTRLVNETNGIILMDEIHRCSTKQQEALLTLVEDGYYTNKSGHDYHNPYITIIGATTERAKVIKPLLERFPIRPEMVPYTEDEMQKIAQGMLERAGLDLPEDFARIIGSAAAGVPRNIVPVVVMARDLAAGKKEVTVENVLSHCGLSEDGLDTNHVKYLKIIQANGGPMGLKPICTYLHLGESSVLEMEQLFIARGWIAYGPSGRELTSAGNQRVREIREKERKENK